MTDTQWERAEITETIIAAPDNGKWIFSGDVSELMNYVFSDSWRDHMYDEYPAYFWEKMLEELTGRKAASEISVDMVYDFGSGTEEEVRQYMLDHKGEGPRFLVMPRTDVVTMACAWLRGFEVKEIESV